ncbi:MAG: glycosyltransferase family 2 protein [Candidatus Daviesbacteria bacterium]|nr:glycosyltransferase family 2 protein [Candidatus Daviesbacteria bacterium]
MDTKISVVINTFNEAENIARALKSVEWADEVVVCDMSSSDKTAEIAKKMGAKVVLHKAQKYVELARNFNISQASHNWVLILDPDEEVPEGLVKRLKEVIAMEEISYVEIPRKNIIFGKWMKNAMWWPDYNIRLFKKGAVVWSEEIHRPPKTEGKSFQIEEIENLAIIHHHYESISQFILRMDRYTTAQADDLTIKGYKFNWTDLVQKPLQEFLSRYFASRGFEDGLHGLALSFLQAFSFLIMYLKVWEKEKFESKDLPYKEVVIEGKKAGKEISYWFKYANLSKNKFYSVLQRLKNKLS